MRVTMSLRPLASITVVILLFGLKLAAFAAPLDPELGASELVEKMVAQEEANNEMARKYEYERESVSEKLDDEGNVVKSKTRISQHRMEKEISYQVQGFKGGKQVE